MSADENKPSAYYFSLQPSEMAVFRSAAQIFAGYVSCGKVNAQNKSEYYTMAIQDAIKIGLMVEKNVDSDDELSSQ